VISSFKQQSISNAFDYHCFMVASETTTTAATRARAPRCGSSKVEPAGARLAVSLLQKPCSDQLLLSRHQHPFKKPPRQNKIK